MMRYMLPVFGLRYPQSLGWRQVAARGPSPYFQADEPRPIGDLCCGKLGT